VVFIKWLNNKQLLCQIYFIHSESILAMIKRSGYARRKTTQGFRLLFSIVLNESNWFNPDAIEHQLAYVPQNRIRSAYKRAQYWDERVKGWVSKSAEFW